MSTDPIAGYIIGYHDPLGLQFFEWTATLYTLDLAEQELARNIADMPNLAWSLYEVRRHIKPATNSAPTINLRHARDIPDRVFLGSVAPDKFYKSTTVGELVTHLELMGFRAAPTFSGRKQSIVPRKLVIAKAERLEARGLIDGCTCGCYGGFYLTEAGRKWLCDNRFMSTLGAR